MRCCLCIGVKCCPKILLLKCCLGVCSTAALKTPITTFCDRSSSLSKAPPPLLLHFCLCLCGTLSSSCSYLLQYLIVCPCGAFCLYTLAVSECTMNRLCPLFISPLISEQWIGSRGATVGNLLLSMRGMLIHSLPNPLAALRPLAHWPPTVLWSPITCPVLFSAFSVSLVCSLPAGPRPDPLISLSVTKNLRGQASYHGHSNHQYGFETFQDPPLAPVNCVCELLMCC